MKKILVLILVLSSVLVSCGDSSKSHTDSTDGTNVEAISQEASVTLNGITNTLDVNIANFTNTNTIMYHVLSNLMSFDENFKLQPEVVSEWEQMEPTKFKLTINTDYTFHNGDPVTVEDVQYSIMRLADIPQTASSVENIQEVKIVDDKTLELITINPENNTLRTLATTVIINKKLLEEQGEKYWEHPIGSGPFEFVSFIPGQEVVLKKWDDYPFEKAKLDTITFRNIEDATSLYIALETGETDFINKVQYLDKNRANDNDKLKIVEKETVRTGFIAMNASKAPFDSELVRRAVAYAVDKESMALLDGDARVINSMVPHFVDGYHASDKMPNYDLDKAKKLLAQAGYENGFEFICSSYSSDTSKIELLQADLKKIGIKMNIEILEFGVFLDKVLNADYDLLMGSWGNTNGDVVSMLNCYTEASLAEDNISFYVNPEIDELHRQAEQTLDESQKRENLNQIQEIAAQAVPMIPTTSNLDCYGMVKNFEDIKYSPTGIIDFSSAYFK